ncbi:MAG: prepilin-type N-terminal cleavage/methylation domain-containing protein [Myxococcaceae bacterium]|nr:prepilin-type N-terminal cleavage/methylation domain-containing protein [Myxococcaceae bacterium]MBH2006483.1 prepilin-type N-terminal cleavage/methylation domain-containing protein [Myxococcaceae bacterium]
MKRGFSLIEILIAAAILGFMGVILLSSLNSALHVSEKAISISERHHLIRQALARLSSELSMAYISANRNMTNLVVDTQFRGDKNRISFVAFGGYTHRQDAQESGEREISYFVKDGNLLRSERFNPGKTLWQENRAKLVCPGIEKIQLKYWNSNTLAWDSLWQTEGQPIQTASLPTRIQVELSARLNEDDVERMTTEVEVWLDKPIFLGSGN